MKEDFLHYLWKFKKFEFLNLKTTDGDEVELIDVGQHNTNAGPDFLNGKVKINNTNWVGSIEMHVKSSDWSKHKHSDNPDYNNVILHVVWEEDVKVLDENKNPIPCLELSKRADLKLLNKYQNLLSSQLWVPCQEHVAKVPEIKTSSWLQRIMIERLEEKTEELKPMLANANGNWEQILFVMIAKILGLKQNSAPLAALASSIPVELLSKHADNLFSIEALLFGQSGLLSSKLRDEYPKALLKEYDFLAQKYSLVKPSYPNWKLLRLRPNNFPTLRVSQLASIYHVNTMIFDKILTRTLDEIRSLFKNILASEYWDDHYLFDKTSDLNKKKRLGKTRINIILINAVVPLLFLYGKERANEDYIDKSLSLLSTLPSESNTIIKNWKTLGLEVTSAFDTQALIHLKTRYCTKSLCLQCAIGHHIMSK